MVLVGAGLSACSAAQGPIRVTSGLAQTFNGLADHDTLELSELAHHLRRRLAGSTRDLLNMLDVIG